MQTSESREHHFVPQFYLRAFSMDGKRTNLFNFKRSGAIRDVSIKNQCSRRNFYKFAPGLEGALADLEGASARIFRDIRERCVLPPRDSEDRATLRTYTVFQHLRTTGAGRPGDIMGDYYAKVLMQNSPKIRGISLDDFEVRQKYPAALPLSIAWQIAASAIDLKMHLFVNRSKRELITSDDPVVLHNKYCEGVDYQGVLGWVCSGLQVVLPLSPEHLLLMFDSDIYKVGASDGGVDVTSMSDERDVAQWNALQIMNSQENIYFKGANAAKVTEQQCHSLGPNRPIARIRIVETEVVPIDEKTGSSLVHHYQRLLPVELSVSSVRVRRAAKEVPLRERVRRYRYESENFVSNVDEPPTTGVRRYRVTRILDR